MEKVKKEKAGQKKKITKRLKSSRKLARTKTIKKTAARVTKVTKPKSIKAISTLSKRKGAKPLLTKEILPEEITLTKPALEVSLDVITPPKPIPEKKKEEIKREVSKVEEPQATAILEIKPEPKILEIKLPITVKDLAVKLQQKPSVLIKTLMERGIMVGINQTLEEQLTREIGERSGFSIRKALDEEELALQIHKQPDSLEHLQPRPPIVTLMGHVDHGKTSLLDAIRKTKVAESEFGGITQHIGAYRVVLPHGEITFLDTPGHEAFTAMRARGAKVTDIVVLIVAADDGVMPQTIEAIDHSRAAGVSIIVAINKIDKPQANIDRVKKQLSELNLTPEDWGGKTITVPVSAKTQEGIDELLEMILLETQMLELKANPKRLASGIVLEAKLTKARGPVTTLLVQNGTLHLNDNIIVGQYHGKIRAILDDRGRSVVETGSSFPAEVLGLSDVPQAGEQFFVIEDEKTARDIALNRQEKERQQQARIARRINLEDLYKEIKEGKLRELKLILKADVQGSLEAIKETLNKIKSLEIKLDIIHEGVGSINSSDVILAAASNALVLGFNVSADERAKELVTKEGVDVRTYNIIYELANDIKNALEGMLAPKLKKVFLGRAQIRKVFKLPRAGTVAGCFVSKGKITRTALVNLIRNEQVVFEGNISSLKRFKDDVREVQEGLECGITLSGFDDIKEDDTIEVYEIEKIARKL